MTTRLITIPMSHYCEKARWGLARAGLEYSEDAHLQVFHYLAVRRHDSQGMVPVLVMDGAVVSDSTNILKLLDRSLPESRKLYPESVKADVEALESHFDEYLGVETRRWVYFRWMPEPTRTVLQIAGQGVPAWQRTMAPILFPLMRRYLDRRLQISPMNVESGLKIISSTFDDVARRLSDGRKFLCGSQFTAADLTFACMAAPILLPPEYGIRLPAVDDAPAAARAEVLHFRTHIAGQYALHLYNQHRHESAVVPR